MKGKEKQINIKNIIKENIKIVIGIVLGIMLISGTTAYGATILFSSEEVSYDNTTSGMEASNVQSALDELYVESTSYQLFEQRVSSIENKLYPVGSIYLSLTDDTVAKVQNKLGGTWQAISQGRVLIGAGTNGTYTFTGGSTGGSTVAGNSSSGTQTITNPLGEYTHKLVTAEIPSHTHSVSIKSGTGPSGSGWSWLTNGTAWNSMVGHTSTSAGSNYYHNNIQPYLVVYMYKRTA